MAADLCRRTDYDKIVRAVQASAEKLAYEAWKPDSNERR